MRVNDALKKDVNSNDDEEKDDDREDCRLKVPKV